MAHVYVEHQYQPQHQNFNRCTFDSRTKRSLNPCFGTRSSHASTKPSKPTISPLKIINMWAQRSRQRKQLALLEQHMLDDIGLSQEMVAKEIAKPFWR